MVNEKRQVRNVFVLCLMILVIAVAFCDSDPSYAASKKPSRVKQVRVTNITYNTADITWKGSKNAQKYVVYRSLKKKGKYKAVVVLKTPKYTARGLTTGTKYWYKVVAVNGKKKSAFSKTVSVKPRLERPRLTALSSGDGPVLRATPVPGASGYKVYRDGKLLRTQKSAAFNDRWVAVGTAHTYKIAAYRKIGKKIVLSPDSVTRRVSREKVRISLSGAPAVPTLREGEYFTLYGKINSNATIQRVEIGIVNPKDNAWFRGNKYDRSKIGAKTFDVGRADSSVKFSTLPAGTYRYRIYAHLLNGTVAIVQNQTFTVKAVQSNGGRAIASMARKCAWPYGTSKSTYKYPSGDRRAAYTNALSTVYKNKSTWGKQTSAGASCDVFVGTVVRASGYDKKWPRGLDGIEKHVAKYRDKWLVINMPDQSQLKPGDVLFQIYRGGGGHVMIYLGNGRVANAHYNGKTYGVVQSYSSQVHSKLGCKIFKAFRPSR